MSARPIAILYEHPIWFQPLFDELARRGIAFEKRHVRDLCFDPGQRRSPYALLVNRVSAFPSGGSPPHVVLYVQQYLAYLERIGANVINGYQSYSVGISKARQLAILEGLELNTPRARVIHDPSQAPAAAEGLRYPLLIKPNIGGSGSGILKLDTPEELAFTVGAGVVDLGIDHIGLVQEYLPARDQEIIRVEILNGEFLYAIRLPISRDSFNYCPADGCNVGRPELAAQAYTPPEEVIEAVQRVLAASRADLGSVEYLVSEADGQVYYYDINPLSNFVADAQRVLGFDPTVRLVDFILERAGHPAGN
jgi:predicted ATP-grasp superfamily ATP-dependent carboligase